MLVKYENPEILNSRDKPAAIANKGFPYNHLSDSRRFEELLYSIYKCEIENNELDAFDNITLMTGVRDKGRDCALLINGKNYGLIQCKKYDQNYSKDEFGKEITKFVLYSILESSLIQDVNNFTYYIAVSYGFASSCIDFINNFNEATQAEVKLRSWINWNLAQASSLSGLKLMDFDRDLLPTVLNVFAKIDVKIIIPADLDLLLLKRDNIKIQLLFFEVRSVTDNTEIQRLEDKFDQYLNKKLDADELNSQLTRGSTSLKVEKNEFEGIPASHIQRSETEDLYNWIKSPLSIDQKGRCENICILAGNAGMGKTVILKDLYERLILEKIPVLALKADILYAASIKELQDKIGLPVPFFEFVEQCKEKFPKIIILIDQIDALSQSLASNRSFLDTYTHLIGAYKNDESIRIIISVRIFDLYYDPSLRIYKKIKTVEVKKLDSNLVLVQLQKIGLAKGDISNNLLELLRVPKNLDVFSRVFDLSTGFAGITSVQSLYSELWNTKVLHITSLPDIKSKNLTRLIYKISKKMFESQQITVNAQLFEKFAKELNYLRSEQILKSQNNEIQFFHQSFYDYVFAKRFVESQNSIKDYLASQAQSIMVRSALKMIINYLREFNRKRYIKELRLLITDKQILFHIKHLLISVFSVLETPSPEEKRLFDKCIVEHKKYFKVFLEHTNSTEWVHYLLSTYGKDIERSINSSDQFESNIAFQFLRRNLEENENFILTYLIKSDAEKIVVSMLYNLKQWNQHALVLFEKYNDVIKNEEPAYYHILSKIADFDPRYSFRTIKTELVFTDVNQNQIIEHNLREILKKISEKIPEDLINHLFNSLSDSLEEKSYESPYVDIISDYLFSSNIDLQDDEHLTGKQYYYRVLGKALRSQASNSSLFFSEFLNKNLFLSINVF